MSTSCYVLSHSSAAAGSEPCYAFTGAAGTLRWPVRDGAGLGSVGVWNLLLRLGGAPCWVAPGDLPDPHAGAVLFAVVDGEPAASTEGALCEWLQEGGRVIGAGTWTGWARLLALRQATWATCGYPYAALARLDGERAPALLAPPGWRYLRPTAGVDGAEVLGGIGAVRGERQTPARALVTALEDVPAQITRGGLTFFNANPFAAFQAWLQGQEDLGPWLGWRHRLFWLDEQAAWLGALLADCGISVHGSPVADLPDTVIVLRHDLDHSRDTTYLDLERLAAMPGVHAILDDGNTAFWVDRLARAPGQEAAFHYNTGSTAWLRRGLARLSGRADGGVRPARRAIAGTGLLRQVRWARRHGVGVATLHRHLAYLFYPEWIDALNEVFQREPSVLGSSSMFRGTVLRWGATRVDGGAGTLGEFPDVQFPYWFPFRLAHAGRGGLPLRGWESASVMEIEPELFEQMLDHRVPGLPQRVITLNYHPAHAKRPTFAPSGSRQWFEEILHIIKKRSLPVMTLRDVHARIENATSSQREAS